MKLTIQQVIFLLIAFLVGGCGLFENEQIEDEPEEEIERIYTKTIEREYSNEFEQALIDSAEAAYPPRDSVVTILDIVYSYRDNDNIIPETAYWHLNSLDGVLQPYMITKDAINYYSALIDTLKSRSDEHIKEAKFHYQSEVTFYEEFFFEWSEYLVEVIEEVTGQELERSRYFEQVYVIEMELGWRHVCIVHCSAGFVMERTVIFDATGKLLKVYMDGPWWPVMVS